MSDLIYLATPYSDSDPAVQEHRFKEVNKVAAQLMGKGWHVFSPISHCHPIAMAGDLPKDWKFWEAYDKVMLQACTKLVVLMQEGWQKSTGVANEVKIAIELGIPVIYMEYKSEEKS